MKLGRRGYFTAAPPPPPPPFELEASSVPRSEIPFRSGGCSPEIVSSQSGCGAERRVQRDGRFQRQPFQHLRRHGRLGACLQAELAKLPSCSKIRTGSYKRCTIALPILDMHHPCRPMIAYYVILLSPLFQGDLAKKKIYPTLWYVK